ncbi:MAG: glycosyltransferase family 39 protein [Desulfatiglandaceae bacterium]
MPVSFFRNIFSKDSSADHERSGRRQIILIFVLGFFVRLFVYHYTFIINPDGALYINQARALYYGEWRSALSCSMPYLSIYPILITGLYGVFHDWVVVAKSISLLFGSVTMVPLYLLLRRFCVHKISALSTLVFALTPVFVDKSVDIVRDPIYWFFLVLGLYLFVKHMDSRRNGALLFFSCLTFLVAGWARIEAVLFIIVSCGYLLVAGQERRGRRLGAFVLPAVFLLLIVIPAVFVMNVSTMDALRVGEIGEKFYAPIVEYKNLRTDLAEISNQPTMTLLEFFLQNARRLVWFVALGTLLIYIIKAFFYPFFAVFVVGLGGVWTRIRRDPRISYLALLSITSLALLYFHILQTWVIADRFFALFIFPSFIFLAFGLERIIQLLKSRLNMKEAAVFTLICALILAFSLPKILKPRELDKVVFKQIGGLIGEREGNGKLIPIVASLNTIRWISFYANLEYPGVACPQPYGDFTQIVGTDYGQFDRNLKQRNTKYFLWEEKNWPIKDLDLVKEMDPARFVEVGRWSHPDTGRMILFEVL